MIRHQPRSTQSRSSAASDVYKRQTRAAVAEGIVAGGGTALLQVQTALSKIKVTGDEKTGVEIVKRAIEEPVRQIAYNAGLEGAVIVDTIKRSRRGFGFNALTEEYVDMIEAGIVDPTKVTRSALQNAASIAAMAVSYTHLTLPTNHSV